ncbi:MAG: division/cell wall cluster transcriptional repressor MraZ [Acidobacteriota bacterium]|nr:division/cell wall cluster transcriptional repressor MraZ [Acidobacteriota bacterium]
MGEFRGSAPAKIDDRGRFKVPTGFFRAFEAGYGPEVFVTSFRGDCTHIYPLEVWDDIEKQLARLPRTASGKRRFLERVSYFGQEGRLDSQGRIVIPPILRDNAGMAGEVVVLGLQDHLEIWNRERFEMRMKDEPLTDDDLDGLTLL